MTTLHTLILGIGNLLWADEGFGVRAVEALHERYVFPPDVELVDGGTQGLYLIQHVQAADRLLVFDAVDYGLPPGTLKVVSGEEVPNFLGVKKMSLHQAGFQEVLALARLSGSFPRELVLVGVQPADMEDFGGGLSAPVRARLDEALAVARDWLARWGVESRPRADAPAPALNAAALAAPGPGK